MGKAAKRSTVPKMAIEEGICLLRKIQQATCEIEVSRGTLAQRLLVKSAAKV
jgi:hypothetical protein